MSAAWVGRAISLAVAIASSCAGADGPPPKNMASASTVTPSSSPTQYPGGRWEPGPARFGAALVEDLPLPMDDGVVLRASVAYPTDRATGQRAVGPFPVIIEHTPYVRLRGDVTPNTFYTEHGYIYALVRARGTGRSDGQVQMCAPREGADGKSIVDWAATRPSEPSTRCAAQSTIDFPSAPSRGARIWTWPSERPVPRARTSA